MAFPPLLYLLDPDRMQIYFLFIFLIINLDKQALILNGAAQSINLY